MRAGVLTPSAAGRSASPCPSTPERYSRRSPTAPWRRPASGQSPSSATPSRASSHHVAIRKAPAQYASRLGDGPLPWRAAVRGRRAAQRSVARLCARTPARASHPPWRWAPPYPAPVARPPGDLAWRPHRTPNARSVFRQRLDVGDHNILRRRAARTSCPACVPFGDLEVGSPSRRSASSYASRCASGTRAVHDNACRPEWACERPLHKRVKFLPTHLLGSWRKKLSMA